MASRDWSTFKKEEVQLMQLRQSLLFVPATLCLFCFAHCLLMGHNNVWPDLRLATDAQKFPLEWKNPSTLREG